MSEEKLWNNARRWYRQVENDVEAADVLLSAEKYAQASFLAQQAAEKAMKAVWIAQDRDPWGYSIARLIQELPEDEHSTFASLQDAALYLDKLYIPTRYPDALADLIPSEAYTEGEAEQACRHAHELVARVEAWLNQNEPGA